MTGLVQDEEGMSVSNLELSINKGNEEIRRTYTDENGRYVFSDVEEGKYIIKVEEENYELKEIKEVEVIGGITENIIVKKIKPYEIEVKKDDVWHKINVELNFILPSYSLTANESVEIELDWEEDYGALPSGTYRIIKDIDYEQTNGNFQIFTIASEFTIE